MTIDDFAQEYQDLQRRKVYGIKTLQKVLTDEVDFHKKARAAGIKNRLEKTPDGYDGLLAALQSELDTDFALLTGKTPQIDGFGG